MTDDGKLPCGLCFVWKHIGEFYTQKVELTTSSKYIWWGDPVTGKQYGRPNSYCKSCNLVSQRGPAAVARFKHAIASTVDTYVADVDEAWLQALEEATEREKASGEDVYARLKRLAGM